MKLNLFADTKIREIKKQFINYFPYLMLEFFTIPHSVGQATSINQKLPDSARLIDITGIFKEGIFHFDPTTTVEEFEQKLQKEFGIPVQVFRKSGDVWLETIQTDNLSLETQNLMGKESISPVRINVYTLFL